MKLSTAQEKSKQIFFVQLMAHQYKTNKTVLPPSLCQKWKNNNDNNMNSSDYDNSYVLLCVFVPDEELDGLTYSHHKLNTLDNTEEWSSNSHHKIAFDNDEDTVS